MDDEERRRQARERKKKQLAKETPEQRQIRLDKMKAAYKTKKAAALLSKLMKNHNQEMLSTTGEWAVTNNDEICEKDLEPHLIIKQEISDQDEMTFTKDFKAEDITAEYNEIMKEENYKMLCTSGATPNEEDQYEQPFVLDGIQLKHGIFDQQDRSSEDTPIPEQLAQTLLANQIKLYEDTLKSEFQKMFGANIEADNSSCTSEEPGLINDEERRRRQRERKRKQLQKETPEQRRIRLDKMKKYYRDRARQFDADINGETTEDQDVETPCSRKEKVPVSDEERRRRNRERKRKQRMNETPEQRRIRLEKMKQYIKDNRDMKFVEQTSQDQDSEMLCIIKKRVPLTDEERRRRNREQKRKQRQNETPEQREIRLTKMKQYSRESRDKNVNYDEQTSQDQDFQLMNMSEEPTTMNDQEGDKQLYELEKKQLERVILGQGEISSEDDHRGKEIHTDEETMRQECYKMLMDDLNRRQRNRERKRKQLANETPEKREIRIAKMRDYKAKGRIKEEGELAQKQQCENRMHGLKEVLKSELKETRLKRRRERNRERMLNKRLNETPEQRQIRLTKQRAYMAKKRAGESTDGDSSVEMLQSDWDSLQSAIHYQIQTGCSVEKAARVCGVDAGTLQNAFEQHGAGPSTMSPSGTPWPSSFPTSALNMIPNSLHLIDTSTNPSSPNDGEASKDLDSEFPQVYIKEEILSGEEQTFTTEDNFTSKEKFTSQDKISYGDIKYEDNITDENVT